MKKARFIFIVSLFFAKNLSAQVYYTGEPVDELLFQYSVTDDNCYNNWNSETFYIDFPISQVTGVDHIIILDNVSVVNSVYVDNVGIVNTGDTLFFNAVQNVFAFFMPDYGTVEFTIKAVGTPLISCEAYGCGLEVYIGLSTCFIPITGYLIDTCQVDPNNTSSSSDVISACDSYTWIDDNTYTTSNNTATTTLTNAQGCDSVVTLDLTINSVDNSVTLIDPATLLANASGADYQWVNCDDNNSPILGEVNQFFTPTETGNYAVEITQNGCTVTSECLLVNFTSIEEFEQEEIYVYPNPVSDGEITIAYEGNLQRIELIDLLGRQIFVPTELTDKSMDVSSVVVGNYFVRITTEKTTLTKEIIVLK